MHDREIRSESLTINRSFIIQAPAGSGKTSLLTLRFLALLALVDHPSSILAMTFTKKAAHEMKERIMEALFNCQGPPPKEDYALKLYQRAKKAYQQGQRKNWDLQNLEQDLSIMTIDAFCAKISQTDVNHILPKDIAHSPRELYQAVCIDVISSLDNLPEAEQSAWNTIIQHCDFNEEKCVQLLVSLLEHRDQWLPTILQCRDHDHLIRTLENNLAKLSRRCKQIVYKQECTQALLHELLQHPLHHSWANSLQSSPLDQDWSPLLDLCLTKQNTLRRTVSKHQGYPTTSPCKDETLLLKAQKQQMLDWLSQAAKNQSFIQALMQLRYCPPPEMADVQVNTLNALTIVLPGLAARCLLHFEEKGQQDFIAIASQALAVLRDNDHENSVSQALDASLHHLLIDEFQDTSPSQFQLLECLVRQWAPDDGKTLFVVGDPMQSIYRFRQADVSLFLKVQQQGFGPLKPKPLTLKNNFRQSPALVDWCNQVMQTCLGSVNSIELGAIAFSSAIAAKAGETNLSPVQQVSFSSHDEEIDHIIETIKSLQQNDPGASIGILARARSHLNPLIKVLREKNIVFNATEIESLSEHPGCLDLISLALCLCFPHHAVAWYSLLRSPLVGISLNSLESLSKITQNSLDALNITDIAWLDHEELLSYENARGLLSQARLKLGSVPFSFVLQELFLALGGAKHPECSDAILHQVSTIAEQLYQDGWHYPDHLAQRVAGLHLSSQEDSNLTLMTCHKSKGLEFDHVIIPFTHKRSPPKSNTMLLWQEESYQQPFLISPVTASDQETDPIYRYLYRKETEKEAQEDRRVFYVSCTRAKQSIFFSASESSFSSRSFAAWLPDEWEEIKPSETIESEAPQIQEPSRITLNTNLKSNQPDIQATWHPPVYQLPQKIRGLCLHASLELISKQRQPDWLSDWTCHHQIWQQIQLQCGQLPNTDWQPLEQTLTRVLKDPLLQWIVSDHPHAKSEYAIQIREGESLKMIVIDRCFEAQNKLWIIDYKTGLLHGYQNQEETLQRYQLQLNHYAEHFPNPSQKPIECMLYFIDAQKKIQWTFSPELSIN